MLRVKHLTIVFILQPIYERQACIAEAAATHHPHRLANIKKKLSSQVHHQQLLYDVLLMICDVHLTQFFFDIDEMKKMKAEMLVLFQAGFSPAYQ